MRRSKSEMIELVAQYRRSKLTLEAFSQQQGINKSTLCYWLKKEPLPVTGRFIAIQPKPINTINTSAAIELSFPNGVTLKMDSANLDFISTLIRLA